MSGVSVLYCPVANREEAVAMGRSLVAERLAGCVNVIEGMTSVYRWENAVQEEHESVLLVKTRSELVATAMSRIRELHRYDCPAILSWDLTAVNDDYKQWIFDQTLPLPTT